MIIATVAELNALDAGQVVFDRDHETYLKRVDGRWAYPATDPTLSSLAPNAVMRYGPLQTLNIPTPPVFEVHTIEGLRELPEHSVISGRYFAEKHLNRRGEHWQVAGFAQGWPTDFLASREGFPVKVLRLGRP